MTKHPLLVALVALCSIASSCAGNDESPSTSAAGRPSVAPVETPVVTPPAPEPTEAADEEAPAEPLNKWVTRRPAWLGTRVLPKRPDGFGEIRPTPKILRNRRLATIDLLPAPNSRKFHATIGPVPDEVVARSTWRPKCPVTLDQLAYIEMTFWGFDHLPHTGEMIVNASVAEDIVGVFEKLYEARFPIEEMRVVRRDEVHAAPTGDTNVTSSFECRQVTLGDTWSQHSYGLAIDINPFHNPYLRGDIVAPELASSYVDRTWVRPGMVLEGDVVTQAFDALGWGWGGRWNSLRDWMHFSQNGH
jgi:D-alanyl-D-alanine carboxypeptidase-like protein